MELDAFRYFLVNLGLHNLVLAVMALTLGLVLGRLVWGKAKVGMDQLRERLKAEEIQLEGARQELHEVREEYETFRSQVGADGDGSVGIKSPEVEEVMALRKAGKESEELLRKAAGDVERLSKQLEELEAGKGRLEKELAERGSVDGAIEEDLRIAREELDRAETQRAELEEQLTKRDKEIEDLEDVVKNAKRRSDVVSAKPALPRRGGRAVDLEKAEAGKAALEKRLEDTARERDQVEEASAVLRKELYGLRSKLEEIEREDERAGGLEVALEAAEAKIVRLEGTVTREGRVRKELEERLEDVETEEDAAPEETEEDDLKKIKGIGAVLEQKLKARGVRTLRQIAAWTDEDLKEISEGLKLRSRAERGDWRGQAQSLCKGQD